MKNKIMMGLMLGIFILSIMSFVSSVPPVTNVQQFVEGYILKFPSDQVIKQNTSYEFEFHIFNISNGNPITTGLSCYFHLYNSTGKHQLELTDTSVGHNFDYSFNVDAGNFTKLGDYYYITQCNSTSKGGFIEVPFEVTPNGLLVTEGRALLDFVLLLSILIIMIFFGWLSFKFIESDEMFGIGLFFLVMSLILSIYSLFLGYVLSRDFLFTGIVDVQSGVFVSVMYGLIGVMFIAFTFLIVKVIKELKVKKTKDKMGEGYNPKSKTYEY